MTVSNGIIRNGPYYPNGVTVSFPFTFRAIDKDDVEVVRVSADGSILTLSSALYNVNITDAGGAAVFTAAPAAGDPLFVQLSPSFDQLISLENEGAFLPEVLTEAFDRGANRSLWLRDRSQRSIVVAPGDVGVQVPPAASIVGRRLVFTTDPATGRLGLSERSLFKGDPGADASAVGLFDNLPIQSIGGPIDKVSVTGKSAVGDFLAAQEFLYDGGVDATFAAAHPLIAQRSSNGRGFLAATPNVVNFREKAGATPAQNTAALQAAANYAASLGRGKVVIHPANDAANPVLLGGQIVCPDFLTVEGVGGARLKQTADEANVFVAGHFNTFIGLDLTGDDRRDPASPSDPKDPSDTVVCCGIFANGKTCLVVTNCRIHRFRSHGIGMRDCLDFTIIGNLLYDSISKFVNGVDNGVTTGADISLYSGVEGGRGIIAHNHCYSNVGAGISVGINGTDHDIIITGNITCPMDCSALPWQPISSTAVIGGKRVLRGRHGIHFSYHGGGKAGKMVVTNNICTNRLDTGIYCAITEPKPTACIIANNLCYSNGFRDVDEAEHTFQGNISLNGAARMMLVTNNICMDFHGKVGSHVGNISYTSSNHNGAPPGFDPITDDGVLIAHNVCDTSASNGITISYSPNDQIIVRGNFIKSSGWCDINNQFISENVAGKITIEDNVIQRGNTSAPSIWVNDTTGHTYDLQFRFLIRNNRLFGASPTDPGDTDGGNQGMNAAIRYDGSGFITVTDNHAQNYFHGVFITTPVNARDLTNLQIDRNIFENLTNGIVARSGGAAMVPVCDNIFRSVTNLTAGAGYNRAAFIGRRAGTAVELYGLAVPPSDASIGTGTWAPGDRVWYPAPAAGAAPGAVCVTGGIGTASVWKAMASLAA